MKTKLNYISDLNIKNSKGRIYLGKCLNEFRKTRSISRASKSLGLSFFTLYPILRCSKVFNKTFIRYKKYSHKDHKTSLKWAKKIAAIKFLGGQCKKCGNSNIFQLCFHHEDPKNKEESIRYLARGSWEKLVVELKKCIVLCRNCHHELHSEKSPNIKFKLLEIAKKEKCEKCNYIGKGLVGLTFHHRNPKNKKFSLSNYKIINNIDKKEVIEEIKKCDILCFNCHTIQHTDIKTFKRLKKLIFHKILYTIPFGKSS